MAYFRDLTPYEYLGKEPGVVNVGWLAPLRRFPRGPTSERFREKLVEITLSQARHPFPRSGMRVFFDRRRLVWYIPEHMARAVFHLGDQKDTCPQEGWPQFLQKTQGRHGCFKCQSDYEFPREMIELVHGDVRQSLGSGEIRVKGADGAVYAAPELLVHYVLEHGYRPPAEFVRAVEEHEEAPLKILLEPMSGEEPPDLPPPPPTQGLVFEWRKHSDLPAMEVPEIVALAPPTPRVKTSVWGPSAALWRLLTRAW